MVSFLIHEDKDEDVDVDVDVDLVFSSLRIKIIDQPQVIGCCRGGQQTANIQGTAESDDADADADAEALRNFIAQVQQSAPAAVLYCAGLVMLYRFSNKYNAVLLLIAGALAGQFISV